MSSKKNKIEESEEEIEEQEEIENEEEIEEEEQENYSKK